MLDLGHSRLVAERLRRWGRQGTWRRMLRASATRTLGPVRASPWTRIIHGQDTSGPVVAGN